MGNKTSGGKWLYRPATGAATGGHVLLQEDLYCYRRGSKSLFRVDMVSLKHEEVDEGRRE